MCLCFPVILCHFERGKMIWGRGREGSIPIAFSSSSRVTDIYRLLVNRICIVFSRSFPRNSQIELHKSGTECDTLIGSVVTTGMEWGGMEQTLFVSLSVLIFSLTCLHPPPPSFPISRPIVVSSVCNNLLPTWVQSVREWSKWESPDRERDKWESAWNEESGGELSHLRSSVPFNDVSHSSS